MAVKVIITRRVKEAALVDAALVLAQLRGQATTQAGYITGETLVGLDDPHKLVVISTWETLEDWLRWKDHATRLIVEGNLETYLQGPAIYEAFRQGVRP